MFKKITIAVIIAAVLCVVGLRTAAPPEKPMAEMTAEEIEEDMKRRGINRNRPLAENEEADLGAFFAGEVNPKSTSGLGLPPEVATLISGMVEPEEYELVKTIGSDTSISSVAFSPDDTVFASGLFDNTITLRDVKKNKVTIHRKGHTGPVSSVAFSPDSTILASGSWDHTIKLWNAATGALLQTLEGHEDTVNSVAFSPDGTILASGSLDRTIKFWNAATGALLQTLEGHEGTINSVAFSPDGTTLASGSIDGIIKLWDVATGKLLRTFAKYASSVLSVAFSPDGTTLASGSSESLGSSDGTIKLWNVATGELRQTLQGHIASVRSVTFSPDGKTLASGSFDNTIKLWNVATGELRQTLQGHKEAVTSVAFSPDGTILASGSWDHTIKLWRKTAPVEEAITAARQAVAEPKIRAAIREHFRLGHERATNSEFAALAEKYRPIFEEEQMNMMVRLHPPAGKTPASSEKLDPIATFNAIITAYKTTLESHRESQQQLQGLMIDWLKALTANDSHGMEKASGALGAIDPILRDALQQSMQQIRTLSNPQQRIEVQKAMAKKVHAEMVRRGLKRKREAEDE